LIKTGNIKKDPENFLCFLGTSGARFSMIFQLRSSGGIWARLNDTNILIDPGPGALVKINETSPCLDPLDLDAIIITHRHIDHSGDLNVMTEAMTYGGRIKKGTLVMPEDALDSKEPVLMSHFKHQVNDIVFWNDITDIELPGEIKLKGIRLEHHGVECFGFKLYLSELPVMGLIADTAYKPELLKAFSDCPLIIANVTLLKRIERIDHLSIPEIDDLLSVIHPETLIITHLGTSILEKGPESVIEMIKRDDTTIIAARDDMIFDINNRSIIQEGKKDDPGRIDIVKRKLFPGSRKRKC